MSNKSGDGITFGMNATQTSRPVKIIHLSDPHLVRPGQVLYGLDPRARLDACVTHVNARHADADLCVVSGDLASHGELAAYENLRQGLKALTVPWRLALGNHDDLDNFLKIFPEASSEMPGFLHYAVDARGVRLLVVDTRDVSGRAPRHGGWLCKARLRWLQDSLASASGPVLVVMHHPPMRVGIPSMDAIMLGNADAFHTAATCGPVPPFLLIGHLHRTVGGLWRGLAYACAAGLNHHIALDLQNASPVPGSHEPPSYGLILVDGQSVTAHRVGFFDPEEPFPLAD